MAEASPVTGSSPPELSPVLIHLLKGVVDQEKDAPLWSHLIRLQTQVREYVQVIGLELVLDEAEGYAFLRSRGNDASDLDDDGGKPLPRLIARRQLSFPVSLLVALLRKRLAEADAGGGSTRLVLTLSEIASLMRVFLAESSNEARILDQIGYYAEKVGELGFLRKLKPVRSSEEPSYEVMRILKAFVDAQWLSEFDARLQEYAAHAADQEIVEDA